MMKFINNFVLLLLLVLPSSLMLMNDGVGLARAQEDGGQEDILEGEEEDEVEIEDEDEEDADVEVEEEAGDKGAAVEATEEEGEEEEEEALKPSDMAETTLLFTKNSETEIPVNMPLQALVGFTNNGELDFTIQYIHASLRYPQDFSFHIYNFSVAEYELTVQPGASATLEYNFQAGEVFAARPFGFVIQMFYRDEDGVLFADSLFNDTITMVELDEGLDTETFFLYLFLAAVVVLIIVGLQQLFSSMGRKKTKRAPVETGTQSNGDVDFDWIPKQHIMFNKKSPSPRRSPRQRTAKKGIWGQVDGRCLLPQRPSHSISTLLASIPSLHHSLSHRSMYCGRRGPTQRRRRKRKKKTQAHRACDDVLPMNN